MPADTTKRSIAISAAPAEVMAVIADFASYPEWVSAAKDVQVLDMYPSAVDGSAALAGARARTVRFQLDAGPIREGYDLVYEWAPDGLAVSWNLVRGDLQRAQQGSYTLAEQEDGTTLVTYELSVELSIPMIGALRRKAEKAITDTALKELKKRIER